MGFNSAFKGLKERELIHLVYEMVCVLESYVALDFSNLGFHVHQVHLLSFIRKKQQTTSALHCRKM